MTEYNHIDGIWRLEAGEMQDIEEVVELFTVLRDRGILQHLQGTYHRTYQALKDQGYIS